VKELKDLYQDLEKEKSNLLEEVESRLKIDIYNLEKECAEHPELYYNVAVLNSSISFGLSNAELLVKEVKAEIATDIRQNPKSYGIEKLTESQIIEQTDITNEAQEAREIRLDFQRLKNEADGLLNAFEHRRSMINNETQLYLSKLSEPRQEAQVQQIVRKKLRKIKKD